LSSRVQATKASPFDSIDTTGRHRVTPVTATGPHAGCNCVGQHRLRLWPGQALTAGVLILVNH
jgi:hypothetical protein